MTTRLTVVGRHLYADDGTGAVQVEQDGTSTDAAFAYGTAATKDTGASGEKVPLLNAANVWSATQTFDDVVVDNLDAGASGVAGSVDIFPATASRGKTAFTASDNSGNTTTSINTAAQAGARTYTVPDAGASASFVMTEGAQTVNGVKTFGSIPVVPGLTGTVQSLSGAGAVALTTLTTAWTTTAADAGTLANGSNGQFKTIVMVAHGGDGTLTPANLAGGTTITFNAVGDSVLLQFLSTDWFVISNNGCVVA